MNIVKVPNDAALFAELFRKITAKAKRRIVYSLPVSYFFGVDVTPQVLPLTWDAFHTIEFDFQAASSAVWLVVLVNYSCSLLSNCLSVSTNDCLDTAVVLSDKWVSTELLLNG